MKNVTPNEHESQVQIARWSAIGRAIGWGSFLLALFLGLVVYLGWHQLQATAPLLLYFFEGVIVVCTIGAVYGLWRHQSAWHQAKLERYRANTHRLAPTDFNGNYEVIYNPVTQTLLQPAPGNMQQPVPQTYSPHYAPHISFRNDVKGIEGPATTIDALPSPVKLPTLDELLAFIKPNTRTIILGAKRENREPVTAELSEDGIPHIKIVGASGLGKSCLAGAILDGAIQTNTPDVLQIGLLDLEHKTSRLFEDSENIAEIAPRGKRIRLVGRNAEEVAQRLIDLKAELDRRASQGISTPFLLVYTEEMLSLKYEVVDEKLQKQMLNDFNVLAVRGRKYGILFMVCMQVAYSLYDTREGDKMFGTRGAFALDESAAVASGLYNRPLIRQCFTERFQGQYVLEKPAFSGLVFAPDYDVKSKLERRGLVVATRPPVVGSVVAPVVAPVVESDFSLPSRPQATSAPFLLTQQEKRILSKYTSGQSINQIVSSEFTDGQGKPLTGGRLFAEKAKEIQDLITRLLNEVLPESES